MFERIKCYKRLIKAEKILYGFIRVGELLQNDEMVKDSREALRKTAIIKKKMWFNRQMAKKYNLEFEIHGF